MEDLRTAQSEGRLGSDYAAYLRDAWERMILTTDALRKRGDVFLDHEEAGCPPVLIDDYEVIMDGADIPYPSNYILLKITPPKGFTIDEARRPYIIIAGRGPGIGGFKLDSQVGVAMAAGHPVCFVAFKQMPEPGAYLSYVTRFEAEFVREVMRRHPKALKPVVTGNCQGGWAILLLAATNPALTGPVVINGAPVARWVGRAVVLNSLGDPEATEIARSEMERETGALAAFLCSSAASQITGTALPIDGGWTAY